MVDLEHGAFMEQVEELAERRRWPDVRDMLVRSEERSVGKEC